MHIFTSVFAEAMETTFAEIAYGIESRENTNKNTEENMYK